MADYDDGAYYEVQLNNKQLVFFFMATLAIAVVVFLCGVMVGRGVRDATLTAQGTDIVAGTLRQIPQSRRTVSAGTPKLDYAQRLEEEQPKAILESVRSTSPETTVSQTVSPPTSAPKKALARDVEAPAAPAPRSSQQFGLDSGAFTIQVVALKTEDAARSLLARLKSKTYRAYLEAGGESGLHRVRVGRFATRDEAEKIAEKLRNEEKFKPYITQ
jgi:cell division septation protein DedD